MSNNAALYFVDRHLSEGRADKTAFVEADGRKRSLTYGALAQQTSQFAGALTRAGIRREERMAMIVVDELEFPIAFWGALKAGVVPIPLNTLLSTDVYRDIVNDSRATVLMVSAVLWETVAPIVQDIPSLTHVIVVGDTKDGATSFDDFIHGAKELATTEAKADELAFWLYSSGSTGLPKGVRHLHENLQATYIRCASFGHSRNRRGLFGGKIVLCLWFGQWHELSNVGWGDDDPMGVAPNTCGYV
jgi:4-hydroxybenzoate-CoA ligase